MQKIITDIQKYKHILFELEKEYTGKLKLLIFYQR